MACSAIFITLEGKRIGGQLTTEDSADSLAFVANDGTVYGLAELRKGEVAILAGAGKELSAEARLLRERALILRVKAIFGNLKWE